MYQSLLTRKYLFSKIMPLLASAAVLLTTATELIVWSVMGGFLQRLVDSGRELVGDVAISWPVAGFPYSEDLISRLESQAEIEAATGIVESFGQIRLPDGRTELVTIRGIDGAGFARVTAYADTLYWRPISTPNAHDKDRRDLRLTDPAGSSGFWDRRLQDGLALRERDPATGQFRPAVVLGIEVSGFNRRMPGAWYQPVIRTTLNPDGSEGFVETFLPNDSITLSVLPQDAGGREVGVIVRRFPVANEFYTGLYQVDERTVLVDLAELQEMLNMDASRRVTPANPFEFTIDPTTGEERPAEPVVVGEEPARVTTVLVRGRDGVPIDALERACLSVYEAFADAHRGEVPPMQSMEPRIQTWREQNAMFIGVVEKEIVLVMFIFGVVSFTSVFLVLAIFWAMVSEKTKDIGVLRSIGASRAGVAWLWLRYGAAIGVAGSAMGVLAAALIVWNINPIHEWLGSAMGIQVWDPRVYYFATIPSDVNWVRAAIIFSAGVVASVLGALWPALRAAMMDPVRALRFE